MAAPPQLWCFLASFILLLLLFYHSICTDQLTEEENQLLKTHTLYRLDEEEFTLTRHRHLQLLAEAGVGSPVANFTTAGLRIAPPYLSYSPCYFTQRCQNVTKAYGNVPRCKLSRICRICRPRKACFYSFVTGNPSSLSGSVPLNPPVPTSP